MPLAPIDSNDRCMGEATSEEIARFEMLLDAVLNDPNKVPQLVRDDPMLLESICLSADTVLHWLAVENHSHGVALLRSLGAEIPEYSIIHAAQAGHVAMVEQLVHLGGHVDRSTMERAISNPIWKLSESTRHAILECLDS